MASQGVKPRSPIDGIFAGEGQGKGGDTVCGWACVGRALDERAGYGSSNSRRYVVPCVFRWGSEGGLVSRVVVVGVRAGVFVVVVVGAGVGGWIVVVAVVVGVVTAVS